MKNALLSFLMFCGITLVLFFGMVICSGKADAYRVSDTIELRVSDGCSPCKEAEALLDAKHVKYSIRKASGGNYVPQLYVNGKFVGYGVGAVEEYLNK